MDQDKSWRWITEVMSDNENNETLANLTLNDDFAAPEEQHDDDAYTTTILTVTIIVCLLLAYVVKQYRLYFLPESAGALIIGVIVGGIVRLATKDPDNLQSPLHSFEFSPEIFFFILLPPIIFEAGYSLNQKAFFENIGAITLYAMAGTIISCFTVGLLTFYVAKKGLIKDIDQENPMEALLFGALISAVDPVATLSIMGNEDLQVNPLLYSLIFGESVLNDAIAIVLFKTFHKYYNPDGPDWREAKIGSALLAFVTVTFFSILVGVILGLVPSFIYKHTQLSDYPNLETSLLFCFAYLCYSIAEALELSGIMALFFQGIILAHYNSYNLSPKAHVASAQIFSTLATVLETTVFLYMGMGVFTGRFANWDILFTVLALCFCILGRLLNIFPLSLIANSCRSRKKRISCKMQTVLGFVGLRGAIAFALSENMPGPNKETYATATLAICMFTTVVCGGLTDRILTISGMKGINIDDSSPNDENDDETEMLTRSDNKKQMSKIFYDGVKGIWRDLDDHYLKDLFGGLTQVRSGAGNLNVDGHGHYEMTTMNELDEDDM